MRTNSLPLRLWTTSDSGLRTVVLAAAVTMLLVSAVDAQTTFNPEIIAEAFYLSNVNYVGEEAPSDYGYRLGVLLPVTRQTQKGELYFSYAPYFEAFQDLSELDNTGHIVSAGVNQRLSRRSEFSLDLNWSRTEEQGRVEDIDPTDIVLTPRVSRDRGSVYLSLTNKLSQRWDLDTAVGFADVSFDRSRFDDEDIEDLIGFEDREEGRVSLILNRLLSVSSAIGLAYSFQQNDLEVSGLEDIHGASLVYTRQVSKKINLEATLGGYYRQGEALESQTEGRVDSETGVQGTIDLRRTLRKVELILRGGYQPTAGGSLPGTSTDSVLAFSVQNVRGGKLRWVFDTRATRRDPTDPLQDVIDSFGVGAGVDRRFFRVLSLRLRGDYIVQSDDQEVLQATFGLIWYPLGRMPWATRGRSGVGNI